MTVNILDLVFRKKSSEISLLNFNCQLLIVSFSEGLEHRGGDCAPVLPASHWQLLGGTGAQGGLCSSPASFSLSASHCQLLIVSFSYNGLYDVNTYLVYAYTK